MSRPKAHDIDERAKRIFQDLLPPHWQQRPQIPDYRVDYLVEIFEKGESTGRFFGVQLKGTESITNERALMPQRMKTVQLSYYCDKVPFPMFLVVIDVRRRKGYWLFLQRCLLSDTFSAKSWRNKRTLTLQLPARNDLTDQHALRREIDEACRFMAELHPASISGAIHAQKRRIESLDPRFHVEVNASDKETHYRICAKEEVRGKFIFKNEDAVLQKLYTLRDKGVPVDITPGEVQFNGSPLLSEALSNCRRMQWRVHIPTLVRITTSDASAPGGIDFHGQIEGGQRELRYEGVYAGGIATIRFTMCAETSFDNCPIKISYSLPRWRGQRLSRCSGFDLLNSLIRVFSGSEPLKLQIFPQDGNCIEGRLPDVFKAELASIWHLVQAIACARRICSRLGVDPIVPAEFTSDPLNDVRQLRDLVCSGVYRTTGQTAAMSFDLSRAGAVQLLAITLLENPMGDVKAQNDGFTFWREPIHIGVFTVTLTKARLAGNRNDLLTKARNLSESGSMTVSFEGTQDSEMILELDRCPYPRIDVEL